MLSASDMDNRLCDEVVQAAKDSGLYKTSPARYFNFARTV